MRVITILQIFPRETPLLIFIDAADDAAAYPLSRFLGMTVAADATILMKFESFYNALQLVLNLCL